MVFPHPICIQLIQWLAYVCVVAYIYVHMDLFFDSKWVKYTSLAFFVLPDTYDVVTNPYRNCMYTILLLFYFAYMFFLTVDDNPSRNSTMILFILALFITEWRSEGFLLGIIPFIAYLFLRVRRKRSILGYIVTFIICLYIISLPQKMGSYKYYGSDYLIVNTMNPLQTILNDENSNFSYEKGEEDLKIVDSVCPLNYIKQLGLNGYRCYNYEKGRFINQSCNSSKQSSDYLQSCLRIYFHNLRILLKHQCNLFFNCFGVEKDYFELSEYSGEEVNIPMFGNPFWDRGVEEIFDTMYTSKWAGIQLRANLASVIDDSFVMYKNYCKKIGIYLTLFLLLCIALLYVICSELIKFLKREQKTFILGIISISLIGTLLIIFITMPEGRDTYFYPVIYNAFFVFILYLGWGMKSKKQRDNKMC